jgi:hypothetical protein
VSSKDKGEHFVTEGEYLIPHAFFWTFSNLKDSFRDFTIAHEAMHVLSRGSPLFEIMKETCLQGGHAEEWEIEALEGLAGIATVFNALTASDVNEAKTAIQVVGAEPLRRNPVVRAFNALLDRLNERVDSIKLRQELIIMLLLRSCFAVDSLNQIVHPAHYFAVLSSKIKQITPSRIDLDVMKKIASQAFSEKEWREIEPRVSRTTYSLNWAALLYSTFETDREIAKIAARNLLETVFWSPLGTFYVVDTRSQIVRRAPLNFAATMMEPKETLESPSTPLGLLVYQSSRNLVGLAKQSESDPLGQERFVLKIVPEAVADHIQVLANDRGTHPPKIMPQWWWNNSRDEKPFSWIIDTSLESFLENYDRNSFASTMKDILAEAIYYDEHSMDLVARRAEQVFKLLDEAERTTLFQK